MGCRLEKGERMKKQFIVFYNDDGLIKSIGIWQRMNSTGKRFLIEFIDYEEMIVICNTNSHIETRYKSRIIENCKWIDAEEIKNSKHAFIQLPWPRGSLLSPDLRETGQGGLAATPTGVKIARQLAQEG